MQALKRNGLKLLTPLVLGLATITLAPSTLAQDFVWAPDYPVGSDLPSISAQDQDGTLQTFEDLVEDNGLLFMLSRSFDW